MYMYKNLVTGEVTKSKLTATLWNAEGCNIEVFNEYGYSVGIWLWEEEEFKQSDKILVLSFA